MRQPCPRLLAFLGYLPGLLPACSSTHEYHHTHHAYRPVASDPQQEHTRTRARNPPTSPRISDLMRGPTSFYLFAPSGYHDTVRLRLPSLLSSIHSTVTRQERYDPNMSVPNPRQECKGWSIGDGEWWCGTVVGVTRGCSVIRCMTSTQEKK